MADGHRAVDATGTVYTGAATLGAVQCSAAAAATVVLRDSTDNTGVIVYEKELAAAETSYDVLPDLELTLGLHATITGAANVVAHID